MLCILYVIALGAGFGAVGLLVERALPPTWPRRSVWCAVIAASIVTPAVQRTHHPIAVGGPLATSAGGAHSGMAMLPLFDPAWWAATAAYDGPISRLSTLMSAGLLAWGLLSAAWLTHLSWQAVHVGAGHTRARGGVRTAGAPGGLAVVDGVPVVGTDRIGPATVGVLRPRVLLPRWVLALPAVQRRYVVQHEAEHRRAHDARLLGLASLVLLVTPWNVALWWHLRRLHLAVETDCDRRVVRALGDAHAYGALLLRVAEAVSRGPRVHAGLQPAFVGRVGMLERRLTTLLRPTTRTGARRLVLPLLAGGLLAGLLALPHPVPADEAAHGTPHAAAAHPDIGGRAGGGGGAHR